MKMASLITEKMAKVRRKMAKTVENGRKMAKVVVVSKNAHIFHYRFTQNLINVFFNNA